MGQEQGSRRGLNPSWNPGQYLAFADQRLRPALDLLARIPPLESEEIVDLGCGPGTVTAHLKARWPDARITGVDGSAEMLAKARETLPDIAWQEADIAVWQPARPPALIYSNAALHWLPDHNRLLPRLIALLAPGGVLAAQMPQSGHGAWREVVRETARTGPWAESLADLMGPGNVLSKSAYHRLLQPLCRTLDIWESEYLHRLEGPDPVAAWTRGAGLRPF